MCGEGFHQGDQKVLCYSITDVGCQALELRLAPRIVTVESHICHHLLALVQLLLEFQFICKVGGVCTNFLKTFLFLTHANNYCMAGTNGDEAVTAV